MGNRKPIRRRIAGRAGRTLQQTTRSSIPLPAATWHRIRIIDDSESVAVYSLNAAHDVAWPDVPVLQGKFPSQPKAHQIAIYNRELVGGAPHESRIDSFSVRPFANTDTRK